MKNTIKSTNKLAECSNSAIDEYPPAVKLTLSIKSQLNKVITGTNGKPDHLAINLYWDTLRSWYNPKKTFTKNGNVLHLTKLKTKGLFLNYDNLSQTHGVSKETIRKKIVKLEQLGLINRSFQHRKTITTKSFNQLIIYVWKSTPHFYNNFGVDREEAIDLIPYTSHDHIAVKHKIIFDSKVMDNKINLVVGGVQQQEDTKELTKPSFPNKTIDIKNRSIESNFYKNNFDLKKSTFNKSDNIKRNVKPQESRVLKDFYPLSREDCNELQRLSNREFSLNAMNEILLDMSKRVTGVDFKSKKGFLSYMKDVFAGEMRSPEKINNDTFRIRNNLTQNEIDFRKQEEFLRSVEYSLEVSPEAHFRKKLAAVFETPKAYEILKAYRRVKLKETEDGITFQLILNKNVELKEKEKEIIFEQALATHGKIEFNDDDIITINKLEIVTIKNTTYQKNRNRVGQERTQNPVTATENSIETKSDPLWKKIIAELTDIYGEPLYRNWFSKIRPLFDEKEKSIFMQLPSTFFREWIRTHYLETIKSVAQAIGYKAILMQEVSKPTYSYS